MFKLFMRRSYLHVVINGFTFAFNKKNVLQAGKLEDVTLVTFPQSPQKERPTWLRGLLHQSPTLAIQVIDLRYLFGSREVSDAEAEILVVNIDGYQFCFVVDAVSETVINGPSVSLEEPIVKRTCRGTIGLVPIAVPTLIAFECLESGGTNMLVSR